MKKRILFKRFVALFMAFVLIMTSCGRKEPSAEDDSPAVDNTVDNTEDDQPVEDGIPESIGSSKAIDIRPCEGVHLTAKQNAFWKDTVIDFGMVTDETENFRQTEQRLYEEEGILTLAGFELDAGLADDEYMPGSFSVEYDLSTTNIDPKLYDFLRVYRVGDNGDYIELTTNVEGNVLKFSNNQNSVLLLTVSLLLVAGTAAHNEYLERNVYFVNNGNETMRHDGKNIFGSWYIEWVSDDIDPEFGKKLTKMNEIEHKYLREAEKKYRDDDMYSATNQMALNKMMCDFIIDSVEKDEEHKKLREQIEFPDAIKTIDKYIDNAFRYLYQEEKMRMPFHTVPFKLVRDAKKCYGQAHNRALSSGYIDINLNYVNPKDENSMYNLQLTLAHELLHICQVRYRLPVDALTDNTRYDEMVAQVIEADALAYFIRKDIIPETARVEMTETNYWGNMRLPINGEEDSKLNKDTRQDELINCGYILGVFLRYLMDKTGKRPWAHTIMKARSYVRSGGLSGPLCEVFDIDERTFDLYFRNWILSNRDDIVRQSLGIIWEKMYGLEASTITEKGKKYHKDIIRGYSYFLNIRCFETKDQEQQIMILVPDENLKDVFPSLNLATGGRHKDIRAGQYFEKPVLYSNKIPNLTVLEIQGDASTNGASENVGYTVYVLDKTPKVGLELTDDKLIVKLPKPEPVVEDGVADGYIVTISTDNGVKKEREVTKDQYGKTVDFDREVLYNGNPDKDVNVSVTLNEFFYDSENNKIMGIESDATTLLVGKMGTTDPKPTDVPDGKDGNDDDSDKIPESGGYWRLKETNVTKTEDEIGEEGYASWYYSASELTHSISISRPATKTHGAGSGHFDVTCSQAPKIIVPGKDVVMSVSINMSYSGDYMLWSASGSVGYGEPNDERTAIKYNAKRFEPTTEDGQNAAYLDTFDNRPCPKVEVKHAFGNGSENGQEMAILFFGSSNTLWIYEWVEQ